MDTALATLALFLIIIFERGLPVPPSRHPSQLLDLVLFNIAKRTYRSQSTPAQQRTAGLLALLVLTVPLVLCLLLLRTLEPLYWPLSLLLLWWLLCWRPEWIYSRNWLDERQPLSPKLRHYPSQAHEQQAAAQVQQLLFSHRDWLMVLLCYVTLGIELALVYRLTMQALAQWDNLTLVQYRYWLLKLSAPLVSLASLLTLIALPLVGYWQVALQESSAWRNRAEGMLLSAVGNKLGARLGGPEPIGGAQRNRPYLGGSQLANNQSVAQLRRQLNLSYWILCICFCALFYYLQA